MARYDMVSVAIINNLIFNLLNELKNIKSAITEYITVHDFSS